MWEISGLYQFRLARLQQARGMLSRGTVEELEVASQLDQNMRAMGVSDFDSMAHSALFYKNSADYVSGFGPKMIQAENVAIGVLEFGHRPVSLAEFAEITGVSPTAARSAVEAAAKARQIPYEGAELVPISLRR